MEKTFKIGIVLLTNEVEYLEEWLKHHRNYGFDHFFVYFDSTTIINFITPPEDCTYKFWDCKSSPHEQMRAYEDCIRNNKDFDFILIEDSDEFYQSKSRNVKQDVSDLIDKYGNFGALGIYWRMYGSNPSFETRQPIEMYKQWHGNDHIKTMVNPKAFISMSDPHKCTINPLYKYIDELGNKVTSPIGKHTSENIWIKHTWTRSKEEWIKKVNRKGWYEFYDRKLEEFDNYNKLCINVDV